MSDSESMRWVDETVAGSLRDSWGQDWPELLKTELDKQWSAGWEDNPDDVKNGWLADYLAQGAPPEAQYLEDRASQGSSVATQYSAEGTGNAVGPAATEEGQPVSVAPFPSEEEIVAGIAQAIMAEFASEAEKLDPRVLAAGAADIVNAMVEALAEASKAAIDAAG